ncbi:MAG TPA: L,D-transpeptidase [Jiangellaceae bacterium]
MPGRYGVEERSEQPAVRRRRRGHPLRRVSLVGCSTLLALGVISAVETTPGADDQVVAGSLDADRTADSSTSRSDERLPGRLIGRLPRVAADPSASPSPTITPVNDPNLKPEAAAELPADSGSGKRVVFDITAQQVWLVDTDDTVVRTYRVSGSRYDQLPAGTFEVFSKSENATSWHGTETMEYMVRFFKGERSNIGFHDLPVKTATGDEVQTLSELGTPLSDGCIRQDVVDAKALWDFAPVGTPVVVVRS